MTIQNKVVVITGASSGIGEATAVLLARKGAKLILGARREEQLKLLKNKINIEGGEAFYLVTDVTEREDNIALINLAKEKFGKVDVLFLNAGLMPNSPLSELKSHEWKRMVDVNLMGVLNGIEAALPEFISQKSGQIITTSSVAGLKAYPGGAVYGATKWAIRNLMEVLRMESAQEGTNIRTSTIYPAAINTELLETISGKELSEEFQKMYKKYGISPERVANVVAIAIDQPEDTTINEFTIGPANQPW
ncbi:SDR family oxidoreductase [Vagococcus fluvialis]|uniref:SDR family oxidoreductase n=1 Tax=Vagococcus fluvialis TaxID=2738 RepID=UPI000A34DD93|nr:SDR family oxidoreductase [Vagococcus fluvialis]MBO0419428.1 SDR family oxidoreductase [Vagococcus fluvialis]MBO0428282.1 SDR family oxidoreductase [Vagococcus fluvialis]OTP33306.1 short-chain dehydrogenase/reductase [Enterococcus sp. 6C8_DIV0013]